MHRIDAELRFFYVPNRILWKNWENFLANKEVVQPHIQGTSEHKFFVENSSLWDYLGLPTVPSSAGGNGIEDKILTYPLLAYLKIYNEYFQDQNNDQDYEVFKNILEDLYEKDGLLTPADFGASGSDYSFDLLKVAYEHDYFTSALPFAQKGAAVNIPLQLVQLTGDVHVSEVTDISGNHFAYDSPLSNKSNFTSVNDGTTDYLAILNGTATIDGAGAELAGTINQLRTAFALQKFLEKNARSGTRYNELLKTHFDVDIKDGRINRPEYIGCIKNNVVVNEVLQTSQSDLTPLGDYAGQANAVVRGNSLNYYCPEHGFIMGLLCVRPRTAYFQGIHKKFSRMTNLDYYWSEFAHIGEQSILNKELYYNTSDYTKNDETFGYIPRYSEYKYSPSEVHGDFRSTMLDWHLARKFDAQPTLSAEFIQVQNDKRIFAVTEDNVNSLYAHIFFDVKARRKIPFYTNPAGL